MHSFFCGHRLMDFECMLEGKMVNKTSEKLLSKIHIILFKIFSDVDDYRCEDDVSYYKWFEEQKPLLFEELYL